MKLNNRIVSSWQNEKPLDVSHSRVVCLQDTQSPMKDHDQQNVRTEEEKGSPSTAVLSCLRAIKLEAFQTFPTDRSRPTVLFVLARAKCQGARMKGGLFGFMQSCRSCPSVE